MGIHLAHNKRILKIELKKIFFSSWLCSVKFAFFSNVLKVISFKENISSSFFQYSDRMVASTETNHTSAESFWSQLLGARQTRAWHGQEGATPTCCKGHWKKMQIWQSKVRMQKKINLIFNVLLLWAKCMPIKFEIQQGLFCILSNCQT